MAEVKPQLVTCDRYQTPHWQCGGTFRVYTHASNEACLNPVPVKEAK